MIDFYFRAPGDPNYREGIFSCENDIENTIEQIRMTLLTKKGEVLGEPDFGLDTTKYLFEFEGYPLESLEKEAYEQIQNYVMMSKKYTIGAKAFTLDDISDIHKTALGLDISINGTRSFAALYED
jgi:hypothetical protein